MIFKRMSGRVFIFTALLVLCGGLFLSQGFLTSAYAEDYAGTIVIGDDDEVTGAYAATTYCHAEAAQDYWKQQDYKISVDGKIYKVKHMFVDNKTDISISVSNFHRFTAAKAVVVRTNWTPGMMALKPLAEKAKIPIIGGGFSRSLFDPPSDYLFGAQPSYPGILCASIKWYKENVWKGPGKLKVGILLWDNGYGRSSHLDAVYDYLKEDLGVELAPTLFFPTKIKDFTPQLMRLKSQGVNVIVQQALAGQYAMLAKTAKRLNVTPKISLISNLWCMSDKYIELAGDAAEGTYGPWHWNIAKADDNPSNPVVQRVHDAMEKYRGNRYYDVNYFQGWMYHYLIQHVLELTIKEHGFPITGEQVAATAKKMGKWDWGLSKSFAGYAGGDRLGWHEIKMHQVKNGEVVAVGDWIDEPAEFLKRAPWIVGK